MNLKSNLVVPAMVMSWIEEMRDKSQGRNSRDNRYLMLEYTHRVIGKALDDYKLGK